MSELPTVADLADYLGIDPATPGLDDALAAALETQRERCDVTDYTYPLYRAAIRRAARDLAARSAPLGLADMGALGVGRIPAWDAQIAEWEAPYALGPFA